MAILCAAAKAVVICHENGHDARVPQAYKMKMPGTFSY
jgi:hypothetical protein